MPGKIVASYLVKVHLREPADPPELPADVPTIDEITGAIEDGILEFTDAFVVNATAERTDV